MNDSDIVPVVPEVVQGALMDAGEQQLDAEDDLSQLQFLIEASEWEEVERRLKSNPEEIITPNVSSALHVALEGGEIPFPLIKAMLEIEPMVAAMTDRNGNTPLHVACASEFAYDPLVIATLLIAYPQASLMQDHVEKNTPLGMLLVMGGDVNITCLTLLLDVAYSGVAGLPKSYVLAVEFLISPLNTSLLVAMHYPASITEVTRQMAASDPYGFPAFMRPFLHLPPPQSIIQSPKLMENQPRILTMRDAMMQAPLHIASRRGATARIIEILLNEERYPGAHEACFLLERKNRLPLFYCALYQTATESAELIFNRNKEAIDSYEDYGLTPYQAVSNAPQLTLEERNMTLNAIRNDPSEPIREFFVETKGWELYQQLEFYLRLTYLRDASSDDFSINHAAAAVVSTPQFMRCIIKLYPWQLAAPDKNGYLPLHLACMVLRPDGISDQFYWMKKDICIEQIYFRLIPEDRAKDNPITILTEAYPKGASTLDKRGNLPLHSAILSGKGMIDGIQSLINAAPMALSTRNKHHRLYPFMLAATMGDIDLSFDLLLANPTLVQCGMDVLVNPCLKRPRLL